MHYVKQTDGECTLNYSCVWNVLYKQTCLALEISPRKRQWSSDYNEEYTILEGLQDVKIFFKLQNSFPNLPEVFWIWFYCIENRRSLRKVSSKQEIIRTATLHIYCLTYTQKRWAFNQKSHKSEDPSILLCISNSGLWQVVTQDKSWGTTQKGRQFISGLTQENEQLLCTMH